MVNDYAKDRRLCYTLALGVTGLAAYTAYQTSQPDIAVQFREVDEERRAKAKRKQREAEAAKAAAVESATSASTPASSRTAVRRSRRPPRPTSSPPELSPPRSPAAAVDASFIRRIAFILRIVVPSLKSEEAMLLTIQSLMLVSRSFISLRIARKGGDGLQAVMERSWKKFFSSSATFSSRASPPAW